MEMRVTKPDAWKLYCEAYRALFPHHEHVSETASPAALQEMVDRLVARPIMPPEQVQALAKSMRMPVFMWDTEKALFALARFAQQAYAPNAASHDEGSKK